MAYEVLDRLAKRFNLTRREDYALGEVRGFLMSLTEDKSGIFEVNFLFRKTRAENIENLKRFTEDRKKNLRIAKFRIKGENLSLVVPGTRNVDKDTDLLSIITEEFSSFLSENFKSDSQKIVKEHKVYDGEEFDAGETVKSVLGSLYVNMTVSAVIIMIMWMSAKNMSPWNYIIPFLAPFFMMLFTKLTKGQKVPLKLNAGFSILLAVIGIYFGTVYKVLTMYPAELNITYADAFYNVTRSITHGDTLDRMTLLTPLLLSVPLTAAGIFFWSKVFKVQHDEKFINIKSGLKK